MGTPAGAGYATLVNEQNVTHAELEFLLSQDHMRELASLSLPERCVRFHRNFPDRLIRLWTLSMLLRKAGFKKKKVLVQRAPQRKTQRLEEFDRNLVKLASEVHAVQKSGAHLVFADESIFTSRDFQMQAWSGPGQNILVEDRTGLQPALAVCAAVCSCHGLLAIQIEEKSFDAKKFKVFLEAVRDAAGSGTVHLFLDNCRVHHAKDLKEEWGKLDIVPVWNLPYAPQYNAAVELYWAQLKCRYRPLLLQKMLKTPRAKDKPMWETLQEVIRGNNGSMIPGFVHHGLRALFHDAEEAAARLGVEVAWPKQSTLFKLPVFLQKKSQKEHVPEESEHLSKSAAHAPEVSGEPVAAGATCTSATAVASQPQRLSAAPASVAEVAKPQSSNPSSSPE